MQVPSILRLSGLMRNSTVVLMLFTVLGNIFSFGRNIVTAYYFGTTMEYDIFLLAFFVPILLSGLLIGSLQGALIPIIIASKEKYGEEETLRMYKSIALLIVGFVSAVTAVYLLFSSRFLRALPYGFGDEYYPLLVSLSNIVAFMLIGNCLIVLLKNLYNARNNFVVPSVSALAGFAASITYIVADPGKDMYTLCYSFLVGAAVDIAIQAALLRKNRIRIPRGYNFYNAEVKKALWLTLPLIVSATMGHASPLINQIMASNLYEGAVSSLSYADKLHTVLVQIFVLTISTTALSSFSKLISSGQLPQLKVQVNRIFSLYILLLVPLTVLIANFSPDIVKLLFERGAFTGKSTGLTSSAWAIYSIALYLALCGTILARVYNALQDARYQVVVSLIGLAVNVGGNVIFMRYYGHNGLALSTVLTTGVTTALLYVFLSRRLGGILTSETVGTMIKAIAANACMFVVAFVLRSIYIPEGRLQLAFWLASVMMLCAGCVVLAYRLFRVKFRIGIGSVQGERIKSEA